MSSKEQILSTLRRDALPPVALPDLDGTWQTFERPREQFAQVLAAVGGQAIVVPAAADIPQALSHDSHLCRGSKDLVAGARRGLARRLLGVRPRSARLGVAWTTALRRASSAWRRTGQCGSRRKMFRTARHWSSRSTWCWSFRRARSCRPCAKPTRDWCRAMWRLESSFRGPPRRPTLSSRW